MLKKNTILNLWDLLGTIPTSTDEGSSPVVIDTPFLGWPVGTKVETIWKWFDEQANGYGGVCALMYGQVFPERRFDVETPEGILRISSKLEDDDEEAYPGVWVDLLHTEEEKRGDFPGNAIICVEYDSSKGVLQSIRYAPGNEEPVSIRPYRPCQTWKDFQKSYGKGFRSLTLYDRNENALPKGAHVPADAKVLAWSRHDGIYEVTVDYLPKPPERISIFDVRRGLTDGVIKIDDCEDGGYAAFIGEHWFWFTEDDSNFCAEAHIQETDFEDDVQTIYEVINAEPINGMTEEESTECLYYKAVLEEAFAVADAPFEGKERFFPIEDQIDACYAYLNWTDRKDPNEMTEEELKAAEKELSEIFSWVKHAGIVQMVPQEKKTGNLILS
ncbi:MAG: hypothetical protein IJI27_05395 [Oscillospiraceae bacterium]|nr:hypothetical protein [Oscillospiraceae bacterium]